MKTTDFQKLGKTLNDAKAQGEQNHKAAVESIKHLIYRDADGNEGREQ